MRHTLSALIVTATLIVGSSPAAADGWYFTEGFGASKVGDDLGDLFDGVFTIRASLGRRMGKLAVEGYIQGDELSSRGMLPVEDFSATTIGVNARYVIPLGGPLSGYLRGGLSKTRLTPSLADLGGELEWSGRGVDYGAGVQVSGKVRAAGFLFWPLFFAGRGPMVTAALWLDQGSRFVRLHSDSAPTLDGTFTSLTFGFAVGSDF